MFICDGQWAAVFVLYLPIAIVTLKYVIVMIVIADKYTNNYGGIIV